MFLLKRLNWEASALSLGEFTAKPHLEQHSTVWRCRNLELRRFSAMFFFFHHLQGSGSAGTRQQTDLEHPVWDPCGIPQEQSWVLLPAPEQTPHPTLGPAQHGQSTGSKCQGLLSSGIPVFQGGKGWIPHLGLFMCSSALTRALCAAGGAGKMMPLFMGKHHFPAGVLLKKYSRNTKFLLS